MSNKRITIKKNDINFYALCLYTLGTIFSDGTIYFYICTMLFIAAGMLYLLYKRTIRLQLYYIVYTLMIVYCLFCIVIDKVLLPNVTLKRCLVMLVNLYISASVTSILTSCSKRTKFLNFYCSAALIFELYIIICSGSNVILGRLGEYINSPIAYGNYYNPNIVACTLLFAITFDLGLFAEKREYKRLVRIFVFLMGILLTGSRKGILSAIIVFLVLPIMYIYKSNRAVFFRVLRYCLIGLLICAIIVFFLFKVPTLYEIAGYRIEGLIISILTEDYTVEKSLKYRNLFIDYAKELFSQSPIFGIGLDNFQHINFIKGLYSHNNYWELLAGCGIIGCALYYCTYLIILVGLWRAQKKKTPHALMMITNMLLIILMDYYMVSYLQRIILLVIAIAYATAQDAKTHTENNYVANY